MEAGTKVGPDQLGPPVRVGSTRIDSDRLGSNKKNKNKIKLDSDQLGAVAKSIYYATRWFCADRKEKQWKIITSRTMSIFSRVCDSKAEDPFNCALFKC